MSQKPNEDTSTKKTPSQFVGFAKGNVEMVGGSKTTSTTINFTFWISIVLALVVGAVAYFGIRMNRDGIGVEVQNQPSPSTVSPTTSP